MTHTLVLLRHGESDWNAKNLFTGWVDVPLTDKGRAEAARGGTLMQDAGILPEVLHTSLLRRAITTAQLALEECDRHWIPVRRSWRLNERHYGALQGKDKKATLEEYGESSSCSGAAPTTPRRPCSPTTPSSPRPATPVRRPADEILRDRVPGRRDRPDAALLVRRDRADLRAGRRCASRPRQLLRGLVKHLDGISEEAVVGLNIPTGIPLVYRLDSDLRPTQQGGEYLDPDAAADAIKAVANQGR